MASKFARTAREEDMRACFIYACVAWLAAFGLVQQPRVQPKNVRSPRSGNTPAKSGLKGIFESKARAEWDALKIKDKKAYGDLLADDYEGVEVDGQGERTKIQAVNEVEGANIYGYTLFGLKVIPLGSDAALVVYEVTMEFPPKAQVRYSRVYVSELWVKRDGQWKELHYQETRVK
jgi:Domain of unknown function (DUF4440)